MEKAILNIQSNKNGKITASLTFSQGKPMTVTFFLKDIKPDDIDGHEVLVNKTGGPIKKIVWKNLTIYETGTYHPQHQHQDQNKQGNYNPQNNRGNQNADPEQERKPATAPYNFIPINDIVVPSEFDIKKEENWLNTFHKEKFTGHIGLEIESLTPLYIRDTVDAQHANEKDFKSSDFFSPAGRYRIPGSSLRGLTKTIAQVLSFSNFSDMQKNRKFHYRSFADHSLDIREKYASRILIRDERQGHSQLVKAGYLYKDGRDFYIKSADHSINDCDFFRVEEELVIAKGLINEKMHKLNRENKIRKNNAYKTGFKKVRFTFEPPKTHRHAEHNLYYAKVIDVVDINQSLANSTEGYLVFSGWMPGKRKGKHMHWIIGPALSGSRIEFLPGVIDDYKNDSDKSSDGDLMKYFQGNKKAEIPCFYIDEVNENGIRKVKSFGYTGIFRLAYDKRLEEFLPADHKKGKLDIAEAIFGNSESFSGRVFFEDAFLADTSLDKVNNSASLPKILGSPKPTTFQHYLKQDKTQIKPDFDKYGNVRGYFGIKDYNDQTYLNGYKFYWHKKGLNWKEEQLSFNKDDLISFLTSKHLSLSEFNKNYTEDRGKLSFNLKALPEKQLSLLIEAIDFKKNGQKIEKQHTKIKPIDTGAKFSGLIRFENLTNVELGALLLALKLKEQLAHKLGMGKPLGLGSVKIKPSLFLSKPEIRYTSFGAEWMLDKVDDNKVDQFIIDFEKYILKALGKPDDPQEYWKIERIRELEKMLDLNNMDINNWEEKTRYLIIGTVNEYKDRRVLPKPTDVK